MRRSHDLRAHQKLEYGEECREEYTTLDSWIRVFSSIMWNMDTCVGSFKMHSFKIIQNL